jgi:hypothetical protein
MNATLARWLLRAYPSAWRGRYGEEFEGVLRDGPGGPRIVLDVLRSGLRERWTASARLDQPASEDHESFLAFSTQPGAVLPMAMSVAALTVVLVSLARFGVPPPHADEGAAAHTWQILMLLQIPGVAGFAFKWLRRAPRRALGVLGLQIALAFAAMAPVYVMGL